MVTDILYLTSTNLWYTLWHKHVCFTYIEWFLRKLFDWLVWDYCSLWETRRHFLNYRVQLFMSISLIKYLHELDKRKFLLRFIFLEMPILVLSRLSTPNSVGEQIDLLASKLKLSSFFSCYLSNTTKTVIQLIRVKS